MISGRGFGGEGRAFTSSFYVGIRFFIDVRLCPDPDDSKTVLVRREAATHRTGLERELMSALALYPRSRGRCIGFLAVIEVAKLSDGVAVEGRREVTTVGGQHKHCILLAREQQTRWSVFFVIIDDYWYSGTTVISLFHSESVLRLKER